MRVLPALTLLLASAASPLAAMPITNAYELPAADRATVNALEQAFFDSAAQIGLEKTLTNTFETLGESAKLTEKALGFARTVDQSCGKMEAVERTHTVSFGSRYVIDHLVIAYKDCTLLWEAKYVRYDDGWQFRGYNFQTLAGNEWNY